MIKVLAIGNRLMTDDGIGIAVLERIRGKLESRGIEVIIGETDFQFCFHQLKEDDFVIILDAVFTGAAPGSIHSYAMKDVVLKYGESGFPHDTSIFDLMKRYSKDPKGRLIGIEAAETGIGYELSEMLKSKFVDICFEVERMIDRVIKEEMNNA